MATSIGVKLKMDGESEFRRGLNNIVNSTKNLDKQLDTLEKSFDDEKKSMEQNAKQTELLERKKEQLEKQIEQMNTALEYARDNYEENSNEVTSWEAALAQAEAQLESTNEQLAECADYQEQTTSAYEELTSTISDQEAELETLRDAYIDAVLQFGEGSDEANELASQISDLNGELTENRAKLDEATASANQLTASNAETASSLNEVTGAESSLGDEAANMATAFGGSMGSMAQAIATSGPAAGIAACIALLVEMTEQAIELSDEWDSGMSAIQIATGMAEDELQEFAMAAREASAAIIGMDTQSASEAVGALSTRLQLSASDSEYAAEKVGEFYKTLGVDTTSAVNNAVDVMYQWGMVTGDSATDTQTLVDILDMLVVAQQNAPVSVEELTSTLSTQAVAYQSLGLDIQSATSMIDSYVNHGGNLNDISMASYNIFKNLNGEVDNLPATFQEIIQTLSTSTDSFATMNTEVGNTGKTIEDVLGAKKAGAMINTFSVAGASIDEFDGSLRTATGSLDEIYQGSITTSEALEYQLTKAFDNAVYSSIEAKKETNAVKDALAALTDEIYPSRDAVWQYTDAARDFREEWSDYNYTIDDSTGKVKTLTSNITGQTVVFDEWGKVISRSYDSVVDGSEDLASTAQTSFSNVSSDANSMAQNVSSATGQMVNDFDDVISTLSTPIAMHVSAPGIAYSSSGSGASTRLTPYNAGRYTFARAYDEAMILNSPTIFGASGNNLLVGGDRAGNEIVVGENHLLDMFESTMRKVMSSGGNSTSNDIDINVYGAEGQNVNTLAQLIADKIQAQVDRRNATYA